MVGWLGAPEACLAVLPGQDGTLPLRAVSRSPLEEEPAYPTVLVAPMPEADEGPFKVCTEWRGQQKTLWAEVLEESGRGNTSQAVLGLFSTADAGRLVPTEEDAWSEVSE